MARNFWSIVDKVLQDADILLLVLDARLPERTNNSELREKAKRLGKTLITVVNKADLVEKWMLVSLKKKYRPCVFVSAQKYYGMTKLRQMILRYADITPVKVGVVGYPNTGKSSVINALKGKSSAPVSSVSGYTKGRQDIKVDNKIRIIDTPGVLSAGDDTKSNKLKIAASTNIKEDHDLVAYELLRENGFVVMRYFGLEKNDYADEQEMLEAIALKLNRKKEGGEPDTETTARIILQQWQKGA
ncbi:MAG: GTPase, partial [Nanoarchaeota archaeon]